MAHPDALFTVAGLPAHPLLVDAVAVLLPLAALCAVGLALHRGLRRRFGWAVLVLTAVAVAAVPLAQATGRQLLAAVGTGNSLVREHAALGEGLLPYALGFGVAVLVLVVSGKLADRERAASVRVERDREGDEALVHESAADHAADHTGAYDGERDDRLGDLRDPRDFPDEEPEPDQVSTAWRRIALLASVLAVGMAVLTTADVVRIGTAGATAVWEGTVPSPGR